MFLMDKNKNCSACNIKLDTNNYSKDRTICKSFYNINRRKNNENTLIKNQQPKNQTVNNINNNNSRSLIKGFSICGKTYLLIFVLLQKQEPIFRITKSLNQNPNIKAQTFDEIQPLANYEKNSIIVFDDLLLSKQASIFDLFLTRGRHQNFDINYIFKSYFHLQKNYS